jgi:hypothetical protein
MPETIARYTPPSFADSDSGANAEYLKRKQQIAHYRDYYTGAHKRMLTTDNIVLNLCAQVINDMTAFWAGEPPLIRVEGGFDRVKNPTTGALDEVRSPEQITLDTFWEQNNFAEWLVEVALSGQIAGHSFARLIIDDGLQWEEAGAGVNAAVRVELLDPILTQAFWRVENRKEALWYRLSWQEMSDKKAQERRQDIVPLWLYENRAPALTDGWLIIEYVETGGRAFQEVGRDAWNYPFAPIVDWKNKHAPFDFYGSSDLAGLTPLNDSINFITSNTGKIIKYHAHPKTMVLGTQAERIVQTPVEGILSIDDENARIENLEMQSDLASSMAFKQQLEDKFFAAAAVVDMASIRDKLGQITNFGVRMLFSKQLAQASMKQRLYGDAFAEISRRVLAIMGTAVKKPIVLWKDPLPLNLTEALQAAATAINLEVESRQTVTEQLGLDFALEQAQIAEERQDQLNKQVERMTAIQQVGGE